MQFIAAKQVEGLRPVAAGPSSVSDRVASAARHDTLAGGEGGCVCGVVPLRRTPIGPVVGESVYGSVVNNSRRHELLHPENVFCHVVAPVVPRAVAIQVVELAIDDTSPQPGQGVQFDRR